MIFKNVPELGPEERALPIAKYYDIPVYGPGPREMQILEKYCPMDPAEAIPVERFTDLLNDEYLNVELGCCQMPDGSGYIASYTHYPHCTPQMLRWYFRWLNVHAEGMPKGSNLKYKIWNPIGHCDHGFINEETKSGGIYQVEALDMGAGDEPFYSIRHPFDLKDYGLTVEREKELHAAGCFIDCAVEKFYTNDEEHRLLPGTHLTLTMSRFCPTGGMEKRTREWIGYGVENGKIYFDKETPDYMFSVEWMKQVLFHNITEAQRLDMILPELYETYKDIPDDKWTL
ncbi:MAG: hypothetical protein LUG93_15675 [Lachnospiraceae bacterium]|nr:hypothetical protein [Lachnospiraceae bacterium]